MRGVKLFISIIICIGLLGGVGYAIYSAATNKNADVSVMVDGKTLDINDIIGDYDKIAEGEAIQLPDTNEELASLGFTKKGYTFKCWSYDAGGNKPIEMNMLIKSASTRTIYLQWERMQYYVYILNLSSEYAIDFDFAGFGNINVYKEISASAEAYREIILYEDKTSDLTVGEASKLGYVYTWLKWTGEGTCEVDEQTGNPVYYSGRQTITENAVFVRCVMPKKYMVTYKYYDEHNNEQVLGQKELVFNNENDKIIPKTNELNYARKGYSVDNFVIKKGEDSFNISANQIVNDDVLHFAGEKISSFDCFINYNPIQYKLKLVGYSGGEIIKTGDVNEVEYTDNSVLYYTNLHAYLYDLLDNTNELCRNFLIFKKFVYADNDLEVGENDVMPYCHKKADGSNDEERPLIDDYFVIKVIYDIREYDVDIYLQLKNERTVLNSVKCRYGTGFNFDVDFVSFQYAYDNKINTKTYNVDEYEFDSFIVSRNSAEDEVITDTMSGDIVEKTAFDNLKEVASLNSVVEDIDIVIDTTKVRFFLELINKGAREDFIKQIARIEFTFDNEGVGSLINPENNEDTNYKVSSITTEISPIKEGGTSLNYQFGGWKCEDTATFGDYAYVNDDYVFYKKDVVDDIVAKAIWYIVDTGAWVTEANDDGNNTITVLNYTASNTNVCIPSLITKADGAYTVTRVGDGVHSILGPSSPVKKLFVPKTITLINNYAFTDNFVGVEVRFEDGGTSPLTIKKNAFSASRIGEEFTDATGVASVYLPARLTSIEEGAFAYNAVLKNVEINSLNENYFSEKTVQENTTNVGQVVYKKVGDNRELVAYLTKNTLTEFTIPENVTRICAYAFTQVTASEAGSLHNVYAMVNNIESIGDYAFASNATLQIVSMQSMPHLTQIGSHIFDSSFTKKPTGSITDPYANNAFKYVVFDFNKLFEIPEYMFNNTSDLFGFDLLNTNNITTIGKKAFYDLGRDYVTGDMTAYYDFSKMRAGFIKFIKDYYNIELQEDTDNGVMKSYMDEYLHSFVVFNPLHNVGVSAFDTSIYDERASVIKIYVTKQDFVVGTKDNPAKLALTAFGSLGKTKFYSVDTMANKKLYVNEEEFIKNTVQKIYFKNAGLYLQSFNVVLNNLGVEFIDCEFCKSSSFSSFKILDSDTADLNTYDFTITYTSEYSTPTKPCNYTGVYTNESGQNDADWNVPHIATSVFSSMSIENSNFLLIVDPAITNFVLNEGSLQHILCKTLTVNNVSRVANTAFSLADSTDNRTFGSAKEIDFVDCSFAMTYTNVQNQDIFRDKMFYNLKDINFVKFYNCPNITTEFFTYDSVNDSYTRTYNTLTNQACQSGASVSLGSTGEIIVDFTSPI